MKTPFVVDARRERVQTAKRIEYQETHFQNTDRCKNLQQYTVIGLEKHSSAPGADPFSVRFRTARPAFGHPSFKIRVIRVMRGQNLVHLNIARIT